MRIKIFNGTADIRKSFGGVVVFKSGETDYMKFDRCSVFGKVDGRGVCRAAVFPRGSIEFGADFMKYPGHKRGNGRRSGRRIRSLRKDSALSAISSEAEGDNPRTVRRIVFASSAESSVSSGETPVCAAPSVQKASKGILSCSGGYS